MAYNSEVNELCHFGVIGMKLGIRKGNVSGTYTKVSKKLSELDNKITKAQRKADKKYYRTVRHPSDTKAQ